MKIGIMGAHGAGKTALAKQIASKAAGMPDIGQIRVVGGFARRCPWPINQDTSEQAQRWIWLMHKACELEGSKADVLICDRTLLDSLVYSAVAGLEDVVDDYLPATLRWMKSYETIYWMRPVAGRLVADGERDVDPAFQAEVDRVFEEWIASFGIVVIEIDGG